MADEALPLVQPEEAIAVLKAKGMEIAFDWRDVWQQENARAFTVAKAMSRDLLEDIREAVDRALQDGTTLAQFQKELKPKLIKRGWWGTKLMVDPDGGPDAIAKPVRLGSPHRLRTIFQTNLRVSYMAGRWQRIQRSKRTLPFIRYVSVMDGRERPEHGAWHGTILPVDDPWWDTHYPPCGWNCRCDAQPLNKRIMARRGLEVTPANDIPRFPVRDYVNKRTGEVTRLEQGIDAGWSYNVGKASLDGLTPPPRSAGDGPDGVESALNAVLSEGSYDRLKGFFAAFGLESREAALRGRIFTDAAGWPMVVSSGLLRGADGVMVDLAPEREDALIASAQALIDPERISWVWITGTDGRVMLVRRYVSPAGVIDIGRSFWRWHAGSPTGFRTGHLIWQRDEDALNARDRYVRDANGRFARQGRGGPVGGSDAAGSLDFVNSAMAGQETKSSYDIEMIDNHVAAELSRLDLSIVNNKGQRKALGFSADRIRHAMARHGPGSSDKNKIKPADFAKLPAILSNATFNHGTPRRRNGVDRVHFSGRAGKQRYGGVLLIQKHRIVPGTLYKHGRK